MCQDGGQRAATTLTRYISLVPAPTNITRKTAMAAKTQLVLCMLVAFFLLLLAMEVAAARKLDETGDGYLSLPHSLCMCVCTCKHAQCFASFACFRWYQGHVSFNGLSNWTAAIVHRSPGIFVVRHIYTHILTFMRNKQHVCIYVHVCRGQRKCFYLRVD